MALSAGDKPVVPVRLSTRFWKGAQRGLAYRPRHPKTLQPISALRTLWKGPAVGAIPYVTRTGKLATILSLVIVVGPY